MSFLNGTHKSQCAYTSRKRSGGPFGGGLGGTFRGGWGGCLVGGVFFLLSRFENFSQAGFNKVHGVTSAFVDE